LPPYSRIPLTFVIDAAYDDTIEWVNRQMPPHGPDIETVDMPAMIARV
jgi:hypothetical protein